MPDIFDELETEQPKTDIFDEVEGDVFDEVDVEQEIGPRGTPRKRSTAPQLAQALQSNNLFGSATTALEGAQDKGIRRREDGDWDLPLMMQTRDNAVLDTIGGSATLAGQKLGARIDEAGPMIDQKAVQKVFHDFQQANNLSDEEVGSAWSDLGNINRTWGNGEKARVLSDGNILPNPQDSDWLDPAKAEALIAGASAPEESKAAFRKHLPQVQAQIAADKTGDYEAAAEAVNLGRVPASLIGLFPERMKSPSEWAKEKGRTDVGSPQFLRDFEKEVDTEGLYRGLTGKLVTGNAKVANTALGILGLFGSDNAAELAAEGVAGSAAVNRGLPGTGIAGSIVEELPSVGAQVVTGRMLGMLGSTVATMGTFGAAGLQSAGLTYADLIADGVPEEEAREKAAKAGASTALITAMFGTGAAGGVERVAAGEAAEGVTVRQVLNAMKGKGVSAALTPELREFAGGVLKATAGEASEEGIDQLLQSFLTADPDTNLADAWSGAVQAAAIGGAVGGFVDVVDKTAQGMAIEALPDAPAAAAAALKTQQDLSGEPVTPAVMPEASPAPAVAAAAAQTTADLSTDDTGTIDPVDVVPGTEAGILPQPELTEPDAPIVEAPGSPETEPLGGGRSSDELSPLPGEMVGGENLADELPQQPTDQIEPLAPETGVVESSVEPVSDVETGTAGEIPVNQGIQPILTEGNQQSTLESAPALETTSIKNEATDRELAKNGFAPLAAPARKALGETWDEAQAVVAADPGAGTRLIDELNAAPRVMSDVEVGVLTGELLKRKLAQGKAQEEYFKLVEANAPETRIATARKTLNDAREATYSAITAAKRAGTETGRALNARKLAINDDFSLAAMEARYRTTVNDGKPLDEKQEKKVAAMAAEMQKLQDRIDSFEKELAEVAATVEALTADVEQAQDKAATKRKDFKHLKRLKAKLDPLAAEAKARLESRNAKAPDDEDGPMGGITVANAGLSPEDAQNIRDLATVAASWLVDKSLTVAEMGTRLVREFGEWVRPFIEGVHREATALFNETEASVSGEDAPTPDQVIEAIDNTEPLDRADVWALARAHVISGARGSEVLDKTFEQLSPLYPDLTREQVATLFTDYGKVAYPSKDGIETELRRIKSIERINLQLADIRSGKAPKRTGSQRDDPDAEIRELEKQRREEMRALEESMRARGIPFEDNERRLKSALGAAKRRMQNEIEEIEKSLATLTPRTDAVRSPVELDEDGQSMKARLAELRQQYAETFDSGTTEEKRRAAVEKYLDKAIAEEEQMLRDGILAKVKGAPVTSIAIEAKRDELAKLRKHRRDLFAAAHPETALEQAKTRVRDSIERLQDMIAKNDVAARKKQPVTPDAELEGLIDVREALSDQVSEMRRALPMTPAQEVAREKRLLEAAERTLAEVQAKLERNDLSVKEKNPSFIPYAVQQVRNQIKELNSQLDLRRREARVGPYSDETKLRRFIVSTDARKRDLERRIKERDFSPKAKPEPLRMEEARQARKELNKLKKDYNEMLLEDKLSKRPLLRKFVDNTIDVALRLPRAALASLDASGIGRQSWTTLLARPGLAMKEMPKHFAWSKKAATNIEEEIERDPDYDMAIDSGLAIKSWQEGHELHEMEEAYRSRLAKNIPGIAHSERGYVTYLNSIRMSYFKALKSQLEMVEGGMTKENLQAVANFVNNMTGRGKLGKYDKSADILADVFFSPRWVSSRFRLLGGMLRAPLDAASGWKLGKKETAIARKLIAQEHARMTVGLTVVASLMAFAAQAFGGDGEDDKVKVGTDPLSSDFGKFIVGDQRFDFSGGLLSPFVFLSRFLAGKKTTADGQTVQLSGVDKDPRQSRGTLVGNFARAKFSPTMGTTVNLLTGKDLFGQDVYPEEEMTGMYMPLPVSEAYEAYQKLGVPAATAASLLNFFGFSNTAYGPATEYKSSAAKDFNTGVVFPVLRAAGLDPNPDRYQEDPEEPLFR